MKEESEFIYFLLQNSSMKINERCINALDGSDRSLDEYITVML